MPPRSIRSAPIRLAATFGRRCAVVAAGIGLTLAAPALASGGSAYVTQIGDRDDATIVQSAPAYAAIDQNGDRNTAAIDQQGTGAASSRIGQTGNDNVGRSSQDGAGRSLLELAQLGIGNQSSVTQMTAAGVNAATISQNGTGNQIQLSQNGTGNNAVLSQNGDGNRMSADQSGAGNSLNWTQSGNNLSNIGIVQTGSSTLVLNQTGGR